MNMEKSREERIKEFKQTTPPKILKQFKSEDDIWDYLNNQGEWEAPKIIKDINLYANSKDEAEEMIRGMFADMLKGGKYDT